MICKKCGKEIEDDVKKCPECGEEIASEAETEENKDDIVESVKDEKQTLYTAVALALAAIAIVSIGIVIFWVNRPINKITKALNNGNIAAAVAYYPELTDDMEKAQVEARLLEIAKSTQTAFVDETLSYDDAKSTLANIGAVLTVDNDEYNDILVDVVALNSSRNAYAEAEDAFASGDYKTAVEKYSLVTDIDTNYESAQKKMEEARNFLIPDITGTWFATLDIGSLMGRIIGTDDLKCDIELDFNFNDDGSGSLSLDEQSIKKGYKNVIDMVESLVVLTMHEQFDNDESVDYDKVMEEYLEYEGYDSLTKYCENLFPFDEFSSQLKLLTSEFKYEVSEDSFTLHYDGGDDEVFKFNIDDDSMTLTDYSGEMNEAADLIGFKFPMTLKKRG